MAEAEQTKPPVRPSTSNSSVRDKLPRQHSLRLFYNGTKVQVGVAVLIGANFLTNIVEKEIDPRGVKYTDVFAVFEVFYNIAFTVELAINIYAHWWCEFWRSGWNVFDFVVVSIGIINMSPIVLPDALSMLRMMRAFRVFRLFKRVHSLNKIIVAIVYAIPGVANAFLILGIIMSIYAILAVEFYTHMAEDCFEPLGDARFRTPRGRCAGPEYFGTFTRSLYTFFQVLTGESWSEMVARPAIWYWYEDPWKALGGSFFMVSYVLATGFMLINVVVAVLLDKITDPEVDAQAQAPPEEEEGAEGELADELDAADAEAGASTASTSGKDSNPRIARLRIVEGKVAKLTEERKQMRTDLDAFRKDMADLKQKLASIIDVVNLDKRSQ